MFFFLYCISEMAFKLHNEQKLAIYEGLKNELFTHSMLEYCGIMPLDG